MKEKRPEPRLVDEKYRWFLYDLGPILKEYALELKADRDKAPANSAEREFLDGELLGFGWTISILQQQADAFDIGRDELRLDDIDPDNL